MRPVNTISLIMLFILLFCIGSSSKIDPFKGVLDRIEGDQAIILLETIETTVILPKKSLPVGSEINMWFNIELIDKSYQVISIDYRSTEEQERKATQLMNQLRENKR